MYSLCRRCSPPAAGAIGSCLDYSAVVGVDCCLSTPVAWPVVVAEVGTVSAGSAACHGDVTPVLARLCRAGVTCRICSVIAPGSTSVTGVGRVAGCACTSPPFYVVFCLERVPCRASADFVAGWRPVWVCERGGRRDGPVCERVAAAVAAGCVSRARAASSMCRPLPVRASACGFSADPSVLRRLLVSWVSPRSRWVVAGSVL